MGGSFNPLVVVTGLGDPERVQAVRATASLLDVFQIRPEAGRWFTEAEDQQNGPKVVGAVRRLLAPALQCATRTPSAAR